MIDKESQGVAAEGGDNRLDDLDGGGTTDVETRRAPTGADPGPGGPQPTQETPGAPLFLDATEDDLDRWDDLVPNLAALVVEERAETAQRYVIRKRSRQMPLRGGPGSQEAEAVVELLLRDLGLVAAKPTSTVKRRVALGAVLADLMLAGHAGAWGNRSLDDHAFTGALVGKHAFGAVKKAMTEAGLMEVMAGFRGGWELGTGRPVKGQQTRFRPTTRLLRYLEASGLPLDAIPSHFSAGTIDVPTSQDLLVLRGTKGPKDAWGVQPPAAKLPIDPEDPVALRLHAEVEEINRFLRASRIDGFAFAGLCRIFNNGEEPGNRWRKGGRFYCLPGGHHYMGWTGGREARVSRIRLEGEEVAEADFRASHLTILYALLGEPLDHRLDPYDVPGVKRETVKRWFTVTLGRGGLMPETRGHFAKSQGPILARHPIMRRFQASEVTALDLQFHEAEIMKDAMRRLRAQGTPALPVHDSLVVPKSRLQDAREMMSIAFTSYFKALQPHGPLVIPGVG